MGRKLDQRDLKATKQDQSTNNANQSVPRKSSRIRGPPKDSFADDFVGDQWKSLRSLPGDRSRKELSDHDVIGSGSTPKHETESDADNDEGKSIEGEEDESDFQTPNGSKSDTSSKLQEWETVKATCLKYMAEMKNADQDADQDAQEFQHHQLSFIEAKIAKFKSLENAGSKVQRDDLHMVQEIEGEPKEGADPILNVNTNKKDKRTIFDPVESAGVVTKELAREASHVISGECDSTLGVGIELSFGNDKSTLLPTPPCATTSKKDSFIDIPKPKLGSNKKEDDRVTSFVSPHESNESMGRKGDGDDAPRGNKSQGESIPKSTSPFTTKLPYGQDGVQDLQFSKHSPRAPMNPIDWSKLFQGPKEESFNLSYISPGNQKENRKLRIPNVVACSGSKKWEYTLVGSFLDKKLPYTLVSNTVNRFWGQAGLSEVLATDEGFYFFTFNSKAACEAVLEGGPWHVAGKSLLLKKWHQGMKLEKHNVAKIPIWVKFKHLPLEYWTEEGLSLIASMVGKPLHVDNMTATCKRITYARVCIEVDAEEDLIKGFDLEIEGPNSEISKVIYVEIEYQWIPSRCSKCKVFGHNCALSVKKVENSTQNRPRDNIAKPRGDDTDQWVEVVRRKKTPATTTTICSNLISTANLDTCAELEDCVVDEIVISKTLVPGNIVSDTPDPVPSNSFYALSSDDNEAEDLEMEETSENENMDQTEEQIGDFNMVHRSRSSSKKKKKKGKKKKGKAW